MANILIVRSILVFLTHKKLHAIERWCDSCRQGDPVVIDIGYGDAVEPGIEEINLPVLLDLPVPRLRAYARETVVAEKFQAMVLFGLANTRMKD